MQAATRVALSIALSTGLAASKLWAEEIDLSVQVVAQDSPAQVTLQLEDDIQPFALNRDPADGTFKTLLILPSAESAGRANRLIASYRLVASWGMAKEQLYLGIRPLPPKKLNLNVYHEPIGYRIETLNAIDALGTDLDSTLRKYFQARTFHKKWRFEHKQPLHAATLRSARIWYDAAVALAKWPNSVFRMDEEIASIFKEYEDLAKRDRNFNKRYRQYVAAGYIGGTAEQLVAMDYAFVGKIPALVSAGRLDEAKELNERALKALSKEPVAIQQVIVKRQGIDLDLLNNNARYIDARETGL
ncbi:MAG: hypothetical protein K0M66_06850 [Thiobacillus sp.]|nr:hypothetical protein [Thiobacillus sp.]